MASTLIDLTDITIYEFEVLRSALEPEIFQVLQSKEALALAVIMFAGALKASNAALRPGTNDTTVTLRRHYAVMQKAALGLAPKIMKLPTLHLEILIAAVALTNDWENGGAEASIRVFDHFSEPFTTAGVEAFEAMLATSNRSPNYERYRHLALSTHEMSALDGHTAAMPRTKNATVQ